MTMGNYPPHTQAAAIWHTRSSNAQGRESLAKWLNEAPNPVERKARKDAAFVYIYGACPEPLKNALERV